MLAGLRRLAANTDLIHRKLCGAKLSPEQVRSSIASRPGLDVGGLVPSSRDVEGDVGFAPAAPGGRTATLQVVSNAPSSLDFVPPRGSNELVFANSFE